ncbi:MAG TPA: hypothetical protein VLC09_18335, partial [Polyangiaceae bacterium]|nr:hypothetical protein [Polyangiaceae bacterium]
GWLDAVARAQARLRRGLNIACPVLVQHSARSHRAGREMSERDHYADLVLDVAHMKEFAPCLGDRVELQEIEGGRHDLALSREPARSLAIAGQVAFLERYG